MIVFEGYERGEVGQRKKEGRKLFLRWGIPFPSQPGLDGSHLLLGEMTFHLPFLLVFVASTRRESYSRGFAILKGYV